MIGPFTDSNLAEGEWENQRRQVMRTHSRWQGSCGYLWCIHLCNLLLCLWQDKDMSGANYSNLSLLLAPAWAVSHWWPQWLGNCTSLVTYGGLRWASCLHNVHKAQGKEAFPHRRTTWMDSGHFKPLDNKTKIKINYGRKKSTEHLRSKAFLFLKWRGIYKESMSG